MGFKGICFKEMGTDLMSTLCTLLTAKLDSQKITSESCGIQSNQMNNKEFKFFNFLYLKYRNENQIIQYFCRIGSPQEIRTPHVNFKKGSKSEKSIVESCKN